RSNSRRGAVAVIVAVCLTIVVAVVAIAMDGGTLLDDQRQVQAGADAAALAAACDLYANYPTNLGKDSSSSAYNAAIAAALANGYNNDGVTNKVTVNIPPQYPAPWDTLPNKPYLNKDAYAEVIVEYYQPRGFSGLLG